MKKLLTGMGILLMVATCGCSKKNDVTPPESFTKFPPPTWEVDESGKFPATMTAVVSLPPNLLQGQVDNDKVAAFVNNECRGEGVLVKIGASKVFFVLVRGLSDEESQVTFKYYSTTTSYMYQSQSPLKFHVDYSYGTVENPSILDLQQLK